MSTPFIIALILLALGLGLLIGWLAAGARAAAARAQLQAAIAGLEQSRAVDAERLQWADKAEQRLREAFEALAAKALHANAEAFARQTRDQLDGVLQQVRGDWSVQKEQFANLVQPVERSLKTLDDQVRQMEQKREGAYRGLQQHLDDLQKAQRELRSETGSLRTALTTSTRVRGKWGELQLRRIVDMALMVEHVDFEEQVGTGDRRPDMLINLPNGGILPVDAKTPMDHYLAAASATDEGARREHLKAHAMALRSHIEALSLKEYWKQFPRAPEVVVLYVPNEACLGAAFEEAPELLEDGLRQHVLLATPMTLYGLLRAIAFGWQQQTVAENALAIAEEGKLLCERLGVFLGHLEKTGRNLDATVRAYNEAVGSAESRLMPSARRLGELKATEKIFASVPPVDQQTRLPPAGGAAGGG